MYYVKFTPDILFSMIAVPILFNIIQIYTADIFMEIWTDLFTFWLDKFDIGGEILFEKKNIFFFKVIIPYPVAIVSLPTDLHFVIAFAIVICTLVVTRFFPQEFIPVAYILYLICFIIVTSIIFFYFNEDYHFDYSGNVLGNVVLGLQFLLLVPWILGLTFNIFHFSPIRKLLLPAMCILYFYFFYPFQALFYVVMLNKCSLLALPVLHFMFTMFLNVMIFIAFYAWGISWEDRNLADRINLRRAFRRMEHNLQKVDI